MHQKRRALSCVGRSPFSKRRRLHTIWQREEGSQRPESRHLQLGRKKLFSNVPVQKVNVFEMLRTLHIFC